MLDHLLGFLEEVACAVVKGVVLYLNFQKEFNEILHQRLLQKIAHDAGGNILAWIKDCMVYRKQRISIN